MTGDKDRPSLASSDGTLWDEFKAAGWHDVIRDQITNFPGLSIRRHGSLNLSEGRQMSLPMTGFRSDRLASRTARSIEVVLGQRR